jgi:hypothetical protein
VTQSYVFPGVGGYYAYGRDIKISPQDPSKFYACLSVAASSKNGALYRSRD